MTSASVMPIVERLAARSSVRTEADIQSDIAMLLLSGDLELDETMVVKLESQVGDGTRRRIDVEVGRVVIEAKKDLRKKAILAEAEVQLAGYIHQRQRELECNFAGILTDGTSWRLYRLAGENPQLVSELKLAEQGPDVDRLLAWLESIMATKEQIKPTTEAIRELLGAESPGHLLDHAALSRLLADGSEDTEVQLKRELWAKLLRTALGESFDEDDEKLFVNHTLLVVTAEAIAHAVVGYDISHEVTPQQLVTGAVFSQALINGVVESDFFDWPTTLPGGESIIADVCRRVGRFNWSDVDHDVMKVLYESVIEQRDREALGEYYTPDWLAEEIVKDRVTDPAHQRVLDPSCGSGTFLFHAVRAHLQAVEAGGMTPGQAAHSACDHVYGIDVHPVAVTLARVTYLLAIGTDRLLNDDRGHLTLPVFLGDSLQWERRQDLFTDSEAIKVATSSEDLMSGGGGSLFDDDLVFPASTWTDASKFDRLVQALAAAVIRTSNRINKDGSLRKGALSDGINSVLSANRITDQDDRAVLTQTFETWVGLERSQRDRIWGYYVRNMVRPIWLAQTANRVDVLVGNPPWLRYSKMLASMQERYKGLAKPRQLLSGGLGASARDLSTLFVARAVELYLREGGTFGFVMPFGTLSRRPHTGFRTGKWHVSAEGALAVSFEEPWDLSRILNIFPMTSCVIRGSHTSDPSPMPGLAEQWVGPKRGIRAHASGVVEIEAIDAGAALVQPYQKVFRQGAILVPRMMLLVNRKAQGPLGLGGGRVEVESARSSLEKKPWKSLEGLQGVVEGRFLKGMHLGETVAGFRAMKPRECVLPVDETHILTQSELDVYPAMSAWWEGVEETWQTGRSKSEKAPLRERMDYHAQLSTQLPIQGNRVVYTKSGSTLFAARLDNNDRSLIDHKLYWASFSNSDEALYVTGLLNSKLLLKLVSKYQATGLFGARDFDKYVFRAGMQTFDPTSLAHRAVVDAACECEAVAAQVELPPAVGYVQARKAVEASLASSGARAKLEAAATNVLA